jgi:hypothetical protein
MPARDAVGCYLEPAPENPCGAFTAPGFYLFKGTEIIRLYCEMVFVALASMGSDSCSYFTAS